MKKFLSALVLGVLGAVLPGCGDDKQAAPPTPVPQAAIPAVAATPVPWQTYQDSDLHFSFASPITLEVNKPPAAVSKTVEMEGHSLAGDLYLRLNAGEVRYEVDLAGGLDKQVKTLQDMNQVLHNLQVSKGPVTINGVPGLLAEGTASLPGRTPWGVKLLFIKKDATVLNLLLQFSPNDEGKAVADRVLNSLDFSN
jgi:hypothetical protein